MSELLYRSGLTSRQLSQIDDHDRLSEIINLIDKPPAFTRATLTSTHPIGGALLDLLYEGKYDLVKYLLRNRVPTVVDLRLPPGVIPPAILMNGVGEDYSGYHPNRRRSKARRKNDQLE